MLLAAVILVAILLDRAVPNLDGLTVRQAEAKLHSFDLNAKTKHAYSPGSTVCGQHPAVGQTVIDGATVMLYAHHDC